MNLYKMTLDAIDDFDTYRSPSIEPWKVKIDEVLSELGECIIGKDTIEKLHINNGELIIYTSYSVRSCYQENMMSVPVAILLAENPFKKARQVFLTQQLQDAQRQVQIKKTEYETAITKLNETQKLLEGETI